MLLQSDVFMWNDKLERLNRTELEKLQLERLRRQVNVVAKQAPFYKSRLSEAGISADDIGNLDDVMKLPLTTKADLRDHYPFGFVTVDKNDLRRVHASSGTRGKPTIAAYTQADLDIWSDLVARCYAATGTKPGDIVQNAYGYGLFTGGLGLHYGAERLGATIIPASSGRTQQQAMLLRDLKSRVLCCTPSYALNIAATLADVKVAVSELNLSIGIFGAEPWSESCRQHIQKALNLKAYDIYGLSEILGPGVAVECIAQDGMHIWEDHFLFEILDPESGEAVPPGEQGELVITTLTKEAMPLLRYRTGDRCALLEGACKCGRSSRRVTRIQGRIDDMLIVRGVNVYPSEIESVIYSSPELAPEYQLVVDRSQALDSMKVRVELTAQTQSTWHNDLPQQKRNLETAITTALKERLGLHAIVEILDVGTLPRSEGKAHRVLDMRST